MQDHLAEIRAADRARPARPKNNGMKPTTVAVVPDKLEVAITEVVTGIATATNSIVPKITPMIVPPPIPFLAIFLNMLLKHPFMRRSSRLMTPPF